MGVPLLHSQGQLCKTEDCRSRAGFKVKFHFEALVQCCRGLGKLDLHHALPSLYCHNGL